MVKQLLTIILLTAFLGADAFAKESKVVVVNSDSADYDGVKISLHGNVVVDHPVGVLSASDVVMKPKAGVDGELSSVDLKDNVVLRLTEGGHLSCSKAFVDLIKSNATCCGDLQRDHVVYTENVVGKKGEKIPVVMKCRTLLLAFDQPVDGAAVSMKDRVHKITAADQVTVSYNHDFIISGNQAVYHRLPALEVQEPATEFPGKIVLTSGENAGSCLVTNQCGDMVYANAIEIDTRDRQLILENPKGMMVRDAAKNVADNLLRIQADVATWQENEGAIILKGHVEINDPVMGILRSNDEIRLISSGQHCKKWVRAESEGESILIYKAPGNPNIKTLKCFGLCVLDHEKMEARLTSPKDENGKTPVDKQSFYTDEKGEIFADRILIKYKSDEKEMKAYQISLAGQVKILNRLPNISNPEKPIYQYILADNVEFYPDTQQMVLSATKGRRVLFFDEENDFQMSAQGVKTVRDSITKRDSIEGTGDVRFHLVEYEVDKLRQQFSLEKITSKFMKK